MFKQIASLLFFSLLFTTTGCLTGIQFMDRQVNVPNVELKRRFYLKDQVDMEGEVSTVSPRFRQIATRLYPQYFTMDPNEGIHIRMRKFASHTRDITGDKGVIIILTCYSAGIIPTHMEYEETTFSAYEVLASKQVVPGTSDPRVMQTAYHKARTRYEYHLGLPIFTWFGFSDCDIGPLVPNEKRDDMIFEYEAQMLAIALLSNPETLYLANLDKAAFEKVGSLPTSVKDHLHTQIAATETGPAAKKTTPSTKKAVAKSRPKRTPITTPSTMPTSLATPSTPSSVPAYRVVFDNFDHETGLGEYAVIFETAATFADTRAVRNTVFNYAKELFCSIRTNINIENVDVVTWKGGFDRNKGENYYAFTMSLAAVQPFDLAYDPETRCGTIAVRIDGEDVQATIRWAQRNIGTLVDRYNRSFDAGEVQLSEGDSYVFEREETTGNGCYIFHFKVMN